MKELSMRKVSCLLLVTTLLPFIALTVGCDNRGGVKGKVIDGLTGIPIDDVEIVATIETSIESQEKYNKFKTKTRSDGSFEIKGLLDKSYEISIHKANYFDTGSDRRVRIPAESSALIKKPYILYPKPKRLVFSDKTVKDNDTGLVWTRELHSASLDGANGIIRKLNNDNYAGYKDWRLPTGDELMDLCMKARRYKANTKHKTLRMKTMMPTSFFRMLGFQGMGDTVCWTSDPATSKGKSGAFDMGLDYQFCERLDILTDYRKLVWPVCSIN
jgi:hypothetical protein